VEKIKKGEIFFHLIFGSCWQFGSNQAVSNFYFYDCGVKRMRCTHSIAYINVQMDLQ